jgi:hypothetical protein
VPAASSRLLGKQRKSRGFLWFAIRFSKICKYTGGLYLNDLIQEVKPPGVVIQRGRNCKNKLMI